MRALLLCCFAAILLCGCFGFKPFQPPPSGNERWRKSGATEPDVTAALLECGYLEPRGRVPGLNVSMSVNDDILGRLCMEKSGFVSDPEDSAEGYCKILRNEPVACQPGTPAPSRDVNKRLSSQFCKRFPCADVCS
jgi:hypothetical protein